MRMDQDEIPEPHLTTQQSMSLRVKECSKRWLGLRSQKANISAVEYFNQMCLELGIEDHLSVTQMHLDCYLEGMAVRGLSASTINTRMCAVKAYVDHLKEVAARYHLKAHLAGLEALEFRFKTRKKLTKWHMTDAQWQALQVAAPSIIEDVEERKLVLNYIEFIFETGLRVEEALRLLWADFEGIGSERPALNVPGTKNEGAAVRLPISMRAAELIQQRWTALAASSAGRGARLYDISYERLGRTLWGRIRVALGVQDDPTSTLKALRRNFAVNALRKGLDPRIIQELMRHSDIETTMSYLRVIGMSDNDQTRALLNRTLTSNGHHLPTAPDRGLHMVKPVFYGDTKSDPDGGWTTTITTNDPATAKRFRDQGYTVEELPR